MPGTLLGWDNYAKVALLSTGSAEANLGASNLASDQGSPSVAWQTLSGVLQDGDGAWLVIDMGSPVPWRVFGLFRTNLTPQCQVRWRVGATLSAGRIADGSPAYDSGWISANIAPGYQQSIVIANNTASGRYCELDLSDTGNPDGFLNIPLAYAGPVFQPLSGITYASTVGRDDQTIELVTRGGQEYPLLLWTRRHWQIAMDGIRVGEVWNSIGELDRAARAGGNILFVPDFASGYVQQEAVFGRLKMTADVSFPYQAADRRAARFTITERL
jgi:hypothetical protein